MRGPKDEAQGARFKAAREKAGHTQQHAAEKAGLSLSTVSRADAGYAVDLQSAHALAMLYGTTIEALLGDAAVVPPTMPQALAEYAARHGLSTDEAVDRALRVMQAIEAAGGYLPGSVPMRGGLDQDDPQVGKPGPRPVRKHQPKHRRRTTGG